MMYLVPLLEWIFGEVYLQNSYYFISVEINIVKADLYKTDY